MTGNAHTHPRKVYAVDLRNISEAKVYWKCCLAFYYKTSGPKAVPSLSVCFFPSRSSISSSAAALRVSSPPRVCLHLKWKALLKAGNFIVQCIVVQFDYSIRSFVSFDEQSRVASLLERRVRNTVLCKLGSNEAPLRKSCSRSATAAPIFVVHAAGVALQRKYLPWRRARFIRFGMQTMHAGQPVVRHSKRVFFFCTYQ